MPMRKSYMTSLHWVWLSFVVLVLDQSTKYFVVSNLTLNKPDMVLPFLNFTYTHNRGIAFSLFNQYGLFSTWVFAGVALVVSALLVFWLYRLKDNPWLGAALSLILGGALGNLLDRVFRGYVVDFLDFHIGHYHWPVFNIADTAIVIGALMILLDVIVHKRVSSGHPMV